MRKYFILLLCVCIIDVYLANNIPKYELIEHYSVNTIKTKRSTNEEKFDLKILKFTIFSKIINLKMSPDYSIFTSDFNIFSFSSNEKAQIFEYSPFYIGDNGDINIHAIFDKQEVPQAMILFKNQTYYIEPAWRHIPSITNHSILIGYEEDRIDPFNIINDKSSQIKKKLYPNGNDPLSDIETSRYMPCYNDYPRNTSSSGSLRQIETDIYHNGIASGDEKTPKLYKRDRRKRNFAAKDPGQSKNRCPLLLIADWRFYKAMGNSDIHNTINYLIGVIGRVNAIFTRTEFLTDDSPQATLTDYGFVIRQIIVHTTPSHFPSPSSSVLGASYPRNLNIVREKSDFDVYSDASKMILLRGRHAEATNVTGKLGRYNNNPVFDGDIQSAKSIVVEHYNGARLRWESVAKFLESFSINRPKLVRKKSRSLLDKDANEYQPDVCLAHLFTHQPFKGNVLGLAYVASDKAYRPGGICTIPYHYVSTDVPSTLVHLNTGFSSYQNEALRTVFTQEGDIITAHELGHNWGSEHDLSTLRLSDTKASYDSKQVGGAYIMYPFSLRGYHDNNKKFSPASLVSIGTVLKSKAHLCFTEADYRAPNNVREGVPSMNKPENDDLISSFCGNYIVEGKEECDSGPDLTQALILSGENDGGYFRVGPSDDKCCDAFCKLIKPAAICSDKNSVCCSYCKPTPAGLKKCTPDLNIILAIEDKNRSLSRIRDKSPQNISSTYRSKSLISANSLDKSCYRLDQSYCDGVSPECPTVNVTIYIDKVTDIFGERIVDDHMIKNDEAPQIFEFIPKGSYCRGSTGDGLCSGTGKCRPFCEYKGLTSCICSSHGETCKLCCKQNHYDSPCLPYTNPSENVTEPSLLKEGEPCQFGYCDKNGTCQSEFTDQIQKIWNYIENIGINNFRRLMRDNLVGTIIIMTAFVWAPCCLLINNIDRKREEGLKTILDWFDPKNDSLFPPGVRTSIQKIDPSIIQKYRNPSNSFKTNRINVADENVKNSHGHGYVSKDTSFYFEPIGAGGEKNLDNDKYLSRNTNNNNNNYFLYGEHAF